MAEKIASDQASLVGLVWVHLDLDAFQLFISLFAHKAAEVALASPHLASRCRDRESLAFAR